MTYSLASSGAQQKGDPHYSGKSHYVIENTYSKNVSFGLCHYVYEKNDLWVLAIMFMKQKE
jgi:hypothetical protein